MKNKTLILILTLCLCGILFFSAMAVIVSRKSAAEMDDNSPLANGAQIDENGNIILPEGSDYLPEACVGSWEMSEAQQILQFPRYTDISEEEAMAQERESGVLMAYDSYRTARVGNVSKPYYKVKPCDPMELETVGIQSSIMEQVGTDAEVTRIDVYEQDGTTLADTVFLIDAQYLIYYGAGNFVFAAERVEAVG